MKKRDNVREKKKEHSITKKEKLINNMREDKRERESLCGHEKEQAMEQEIE